MKIMNNLRFAIRQLRKSPGFTIVAIVTLALCIGANTAIFSVINAVLLRPLPYPNPDRLIIVTETDANQPSISVSFPDYLDWKKENTVFENIAVSRRETSNLSGLQGIQPEQILGALVTANFFQVIGLKPQIGRVFTEEEDRAGGPALAVISDKLWQRLFQRDPSVLGRTLNFAGEFYTVIGVMPPQMFSPRTAEVWFPLKRRAVGPGWLERDNHPGLFGWGRLKENVSVEAARAQMQQIAARLEKALSAIQFPRRHDRYSAFGNSGGNVSHELDVALRRGRCGVAHRLRQSRESACGAWRSAGAGIRSPRRGGRFALADR